MAADQVEKIAQFVHFTAANTEARHLDLPESGSRVGARNQRRYQLGQLHRRQDGKGHKVARRGFFPVAATDKKFVAILDVLRVGRL